MTLTAPPRSDAYVSTHSTVAYAENSSLATGTVSEGVVNIESLQSGVFCTAKTIAANVTSPIGVSFDLVRVNPHPGTVEWPHKTLP